MHLLTIEPQLHTHVYVANPHALLTNGVVTDVVFMQEYDENEIKETLAKYSYDEVIRWDDYGYSMHVGYVRVGDWVVTPQPTPMHVFNNNTGGWDAPAEPVKTDYVCAPCDSKKEMSN